MDTVWVGHQAGIVVFLGALLLIALSNRRALRRSSDTGLPGRLPRISVLVPARNEAQNIKACARSLLAQIYPDFEVLVLDDRSEDETARHLAAIAEEDSRLRVLNGEPTPPGWLGKHWACHQLVQQARGDLLLFADADTRHRPDALVRAVRAQRYLQADLLTAFPRQRVVSWGERLTVPILPWSIFCFLPIALAERIKTPALSATIGQFMLFRRDAYERIGGHAGIRRHAADDLALGRGIKRRGLRWRLMDGQDFVECRMYSDFQAALEGFSKNLYPASNYRTLPFLFVWLWIGFVFLQPVGVLALSAMGLLRPEPALWLSALAALQAVILWGLTIWQFGLPRYLALLYPLIVLLGVTIAMRSLWITRTGRATWKGRRLTPASSRETAIQAAEESR